LTLPPNDYSISYACPTGVLSTDQNGYEPYSYNITSITGHMYGVTVQGSTCPVTVNSRQSVPSPPYNTSGGIPTPDIYAAQLPTGYYPVFSPTHTGTDVVDWVQYCMTLDYGSLQTHLLESIGSLSTVAAASGLDSAIYDINETHTIISGGSSQTGVVYAMGEPTDFTFVTADATQFDSKEIIWDSLFPGGLWLPPGSGVNICNTYASYQTETLPINTYQGPSQGCVYATLP
jgi:hypothetical protein